MRKYQLVRSAIKQLTEQQKELKPQRKTVHLKVPRVVDPEYALNVIRKGRYDLMHMHMAYRVLKGKDIIYPKRAQYSQSKIDGYVKQFTVATKVA